MDAMDTQIIKDHLAEIAAQMDTHRFITNRNLVCVQNHLTIVAVLLLIIVLLLLPYGEIADAAPKLWFELRSLVKR